MHGDLVSDLHLGQPDIDREHEKLVELVIAFERVCLNGGTLAAIEDHLDTIIATAVRHFDNEERAMRSSGYPDIETYADAHNTLLTQLRSLKSMLGQGLMAIGWGTVHYLRCWLLDHIDTLDRAFVDYARCLANLPPSMRPKDVELADVSPATAE